MKVSGKPVPTSLGIFFIAFALVASPAVFSGAKGAQSPFVFMSIFGGLFVAIPAAFGIGVLLENRRKRH